MMPTEQSRRRWDGVDYGPCLVDGCDRRAKYKEAQLCKRCYMRQWERGSTEDPKAYLRADQSPPLADIYWAAGFLEGEGCFADYGDGPYVICVQVQRQPLDRLRSILGGSVNEQKGRGKSKDHWRWMVTGYRARGVMMTLHPLLSPDRQQQVEEAIARGRAA